MSIREKYSQIHMGVQVTITCYSEDKGQGDDACRAAFARFAELDDIMSDYRPSSELMRLCARSGQGPVEIGRDLFIVLKRAHEVAELTGGAFDVTCGPLVRLWREARKDFVVPSSDAIEAALRRTGYTNLVLDERASTAELTVADMLLDLGGIAKGYACDEALTVLSSLGIESAMVEAGGDIALSGPPPAKEGWTIGILGSSETLSLARCAVSTSGDFEQHLVIDGKRFSHVLDPRTGMGLIDSDQVTIIARDAMTADSLTKVCAVFGAEKSRTVLNRYGAKSIWQDVSRIG